MNRSALQLISLLAEQEQDFSKVDIRVGTIELVEDVPKSDKLVRMTVDFGDHKRKILAGIRKERANPKEIEGKQALFVVNLAPRKMMGEVSEGMLFDIGAADQAGSGKGPQDRVYDL